MTQSLVPSRRVWTRQPQRVVEIDRAHRAIIGNIVLLDYVAPISRVIKIGTVGSAVNGAGVASYCSGSGNRIDLGANRSPATRNCTAIVVFRVRALTSTARLVVTHSASNTGGISISVNAAGAVEISSGDGLGTSSYNRRSLTTAPGVVVVGREYTVVAGFTSATTGYIYVNGVAKAITPSGTAASYAPGSGNGLLHAIYNEGTWYYGNQEINACVVLENVVAESVAKTISENPWQIFQPREQQTFYSIGGGGLASVYGDNAVAYAIREMLSSDSGIEYAIRNAIYRDDAVGYALRAAISANSAVGYVLRQAIAKDDLESYLIRGIAQSDDAEAYKIRGLVQTSDNETYSIRSSVQASVSTAYDVMSSATVAANNAVSYAVRGMASSDAVTGYTLRSAVAASESSAYSVRSAVSRDAVAGYEIAAAESSVYADSTVAYSVDGVAPSCPSAESIAAAVLAALQATTIPVNIEAVNSIPIKGAGTPSNPWNPA